MNKIFFNLIKIYFKQLFSLQIERFKVSDKKKNSEQSHNIDIKAGKVITKDINIKSILKQAGLLILIIYGLGVFLSGFGYISFNVLSQLRAVGDAKIDIGGNLLDRQTLTSYVLTFFCVILGFLNIVISFFSLNYFLNLTSSEEYLLSLPVKDKTLFFVKIIVISLTNGFFFILMTALLFFVYGIIEKLSLIYFVIFFFQAIIVQFFASLISIIVSLLLLNVFKFLKNKDLMTYLSIFILLPLLIAYNMFFQNIMQNPGMIQTSLFTTLNRSFGLLNLIFKIFSPLFYFYKFIIYSFFINNAFLRFFYFFIQLLIIVTFSIITIYLFGPIFKKLMMQTDIKKEKKLKTKIKEKILKNENSPFISLFKKEILATYREPTYFLNGPFVIILLPIILGISFYFQYKNLGEIKILLNQLLSSKDNISLIVSIILVAGFIIGDFSSITSTAISREGKNFGLLKVLPFKVKEYIWSKILHGLTLTILGTILLGVFAGIILRINLLILFIVMITSIVSSIIFHLVSFSFDIASPKLNWDNPIIAMKQNFNAVYSIFFAMGYAVFLFFQSKYVIKFSMDITQKTFPFLNGNINYIVLPGLFILLLLTLIENIVVYKIIFPGLEKRFYTIEL